MTSRICRFVERESMDYARPLFVLLLLVCFVAAFLVGPTAAQATSQARHDGVLIFPLLPVGQPDVAIVQAVNNALAEAAAQVTVIPVWAGEGLKKKFKVAPEAALAACKDDLTCIAKLGRRAGARELLLGQARVAEQGVGLMFIAIAADGSGMLRKVRVNVASAELAPSVIGDGFYALLGVTATGTISVVAINDNTDIQIDGTTVGKGPGRYDVAAGRHTVALAGTTHSVMVHPGKTIDLQAFVVAVQSAPSTSTTATEFPKPQVTPWTMRRWAGIGLAASAAVPLIVGITYGSRMQTAKGYVNESTSQVDTLYYQASVNRYRDAANTSYIIAGAMFVAGVAVIGYDWYAVAVPERNNGDTKVQALIGCGF